MTKNTMNRIVLLIEYYHLVANGKNVIKHFKVFDSKLQDSNITDMFL